MAANNNKSERGFAKMTEKERREIARKGGERVPDEQRSFSQDRELASQAGRKGGELASWNNRARRTGGHGKPCPPALFLPALSYQLRSSETQQ
jgi:general stress protein YciG